MGQMSASKGGSTPWLRTGDRGADRVLGGHHDKARSVTGNKYGAGGLTKGDDTSLDSLDSHSSTSREVSATRRSGGTGNRGISEGWLRWLHPTYLGTLVLFMLILFIIHHVSVQNSIGSQQRSPFRRDPQQAFEAAFIKGERSDNLPVTGVEGRYGAMNLETLESEEGQASSARTEGIQGLIPEELVGGEAYKRVQKLIREARNLRLRRRSEKPQIPPVKGLPVYSEEEAYQLEWNYLMKEKKWPYVGNDYYLDHYKAIQSRGVAGASAGNGFKGHVEAKDTDLIRVHYLNSLATFPYTTKHKMHGSLGFHPNGTQAWKPSKMPPPIIDDKGGKNAADGVQSSVALKNGGFYLALSDALPLDNENVIDTRDDFCALEKYDIDTYEDVSIIIVFFNEHMSTLLRTVHSVLNLTPPPLLREIILVDDHSDTDDTKPGGFLENYVKLLPKVKLLRLPERRGLVQARISGAKVAKAPIFVVLDSHIEVNPGWLEPQLKRLTESPKSVVFPQILSINPETMEHSANSGIGCYLSFKWMMQERPYFDKSSSAAPVPSASMAGGLFAMRRDWFFESGAYDEEFAFWGAENVEMAFRVWLCGGRVECTPCARTYHIYRKGGVGYSSPSKFIKRNRGRTARLWLGEYWDFARHFVGFGDGDGNDRSTLESLGNFDKMLQLKKDLQCKDFDWFLQNVDKTKKDVTLENFKLLGAVRSRMSARSPKCLDSLQNKGSNEPFGIYGCHGDNGSQGWFENAKTHQIRNMASEHLCLGSQLRFTACDQPVYDSRWLTLKHRGWIVAVADSALLPSDEVIQKALQGNVGDAGSVDAEAQREEAIAANLSKSDRCLALEGKKLLMKECNPEDESIAWDFDYFKPGAGYQPLDFSLSYKKLHNIE